MIDQTIDREKLLSVAQILPGAVTEALRYLDRLAEAIDRLESHTCTGTAYWRDKNHPQKALKLYAIHRIGHSCPIHGAPEPGRRLRTYVGTDPERQAATLALIENHARRQYLTAERDRLAQELAQAEGLLRALLLGLGYDPHTGERRNLEQTYTIEQLMIL